MWLEPIRLNRQNCTIFRCKSYGNILKYNEMTHALKAIDLSDNYAVLFFILLTSRKAKMDTVKKEGLVQVGFISWLAGVLYISTGGGINSHQNEGHIHMLAAQCVNLISNHLSLSVTFVVWRMAVMLDNGCEERLFRIWGVFRFIVIWQAPDGMHICCAVMFPYTLTRHLCFPLFGFFPFAFGFVHCNL